MPSAALLKEAERIMVICNACRYCEGYCAVFPAMELRRTFTDRDLKYLANLCHDCRGCYYACQYAPPHEFDLNVPKTLAGLRLETYRDLMRPRALRDLFRRNALAVSLVASLSVTLVVLFTFLLRGSAVFFGVHTGENAFYQVIPYPAMVLPFSALSLFILAALGMGTASLWREMGGKPNELLGLRANGQALWDVLRLRFLDGGGYGCNYPDQRFTMLRRYLHHAVFYGFLLCMASTALAAFYDHFLRLPAPYPFWSWPVVIGALGGIAVLTGTGGLLYLKRLMDRRPAVPQSLGMDTCFTVLLFLTCLTGLLLLALRETPAMGMLLALHLGLVAGFLITMPYGKFVHAVYRYAALVRNAIEQSQN